MLRFGVLLLLGMASAALAQTAAPADRAPVPKATHTCSADALGVLPNPVEIAFRIAADGTVVQTAILQTSGSASADQAAVTCVKAWTYEPAMRGGTPVEWVARVTLQSSESRGTFLYDERRQNTTMANVTPAMAKAFDRLIRDAQSRCQLLYPVFLEGSESPKARNRVVAKRFADGRVETSISMSSPEPKADERARQCVAYLIGRHDDLPPVFAVEIEIDWARYEE